VASLQYVIDSICSKLTVESMYRLVDSRLAQGPFKAEDIVPVIQKEDRSLDRESAKMLADAAFDAMSQRGDLRVVGDAVYPAK
jgi:hypothetical protein